MTAENRQLNRVLAPAPATVTASAGALRDPIPDRIAVTTIRAGSLLVVLFQTAYLLIDLSHGRVFNPTVFILHLANIAGGVVGLLWTLKFIGHRHWRELAFGTISWLIFSTALISLMSGRSGSFYLSVVLLVMGSAALVPWGPRWQLSINVVALAAMLMQSLETHNLLFQMHWLAVLIAMGVAQSSIFINQHYWREIEQARNDALEASEAKSGFLSSMSHEIRTPMNAIVGLAEVLGETALTNEQRRYVNTMTANGKSLLELINNILDLAKIESGHLSSVEEEFDLAELSEQVADSLALRAHEKNLELTVWIDPKVPARVIGDSMRVRQIIVNLLNNAVKFTEFGDVSLTVEPVFADAGQAEISFTISDTGIGIPEEKLGAVFQVFTQLDSSASRRHEGSGLGLTIVNRLLDLLGGRLAVKSEILKGSSFEARISFKLPAQVPKPEPAADFAGCRVLIVDDNPASLSTVAKLIESIGAAADQCRAAMGAITAIEAASDAGRPYSVLLVDSKMPDLSGIELYRMLRSRNYPAPTILMLTSDELNDRAERMREAGLKSYIVKPVKRAELLRTLRDALAGSVDNPAAANDEATPAIPALTGERRILLAEDNPGNRMLVKAFLKGAAFQIDEAENGAVAVNKFTSGKYDLVLMDMYMPVVNGYEAAGAIRKWEAEHSAPRTPIIALTAAAMSGDMQRSLQAGCDYHVPKPVSKAVLLKLLESIFSGGAAAESAANSYGGMADIDDPAMVAEISQLFVAEMDRLNLAIDAAAEVGDFKRLSDAVHALKGSAAMVGAKRVAAICKEIEAAISEAAQDRIQADLIELKSEEVRAREVFSKKSELLAKPGPRASNEYQRTI